MSSGKHGRCEAEGALTLVVVLQVGIQCASGEDGPQAWEEEPDLAVINRGLRL